MFFIVLVSYRRLFIELRSIEKICNIIIWVLVCFHFHISFGGLFGGFFTLLLVVEDHECYSF